METLLASCLQEPSLKDKFYIPRFRNRLDTIDVWKIQTGQKLLDIGCGQGESTLALAQAVGPAGLVTGADPAQPEYGTPFTVSESHEYIIKSQLGVQTRFHHGDAGSALRNMHSPPHTAYDAATLCYSLMYFPTMESVFALFQTLADAGISTVYVCEYTFAASTSEQMPHYLAAQAQALFHSYRGPHQPGPREPNVRAAPTPADIEEAAFGAGCKIESSGIIVPEPDMLEGFFEARHVAGENFAKTVVEQHLDPKMEAEILSYGPRVRDELESLEKQGNQHGRAMDVWWATFELVPSAESSTWCSIL